MKEEITLSGNFWQASGIFIPARFAKPIPVD